MRDRPILDYEPDRRPEKGTPILPFRRRLRIMLPWCAAPFLAFFATMALLFMFGDRTPAWLLWPPVLSVALPGVGAWLLHRAENRELARLAPRRCVEMLPGWHLSRSAGKQVNSVANTQRLGGLAAWPFRRSDGL